MDNLEKPSEGKKEEYMPRYLFGTGNFRSSPKCGERNESRGSSLRSSSSFHEDLRTPSEIRSRMETPIKSPQRSLSNDTPDKEFSILRSSIQSDFLSPCGQIEFTKTNSSVSLKSNLPPKNSLFELLNPINDRQDISPFRTSATENPKEGEDKEISGVDEGSEGDLSNFTTVFGFPESQIDQVVKYFENFHYKFVVDGTCRTSHGGVLDSLPKSSNWIHIKWKDKVGFERALGKQGKFFCYTKTHRKNRASGETDEIECFVIGVVPTSRFVASFHHHTEDPNLFKSTPQRHRNDTRKDTNIYKSTNTICNKGSRGGSILDNLLGFFLGT